MSFRTLLRAITWTRNNLDVVALVAVAWVISGYGIGNTLDMRHWPAPYPLGYAMAGVIVAEAVAFAYWLSRD